MPSLDDARITPGTGQIVFPAHAEELPSTATVNIPPPVSQPVAPPPVWRDRFFGDPNTDSFSNVATNRDGSVLYAAGQHIYQSIDGGGSWNKVYSIIGSFANAIACSGNGSTIVASLSDNKSIVVSSNAGATWTTIDLSTQNDPAPCPYNIAISADGTKAYITGNAGTTPDLFYSHNSGASWTLSAASNSNFSCLACSADGNVVAIGGQDGNVYVSTDAGVTFASRVVNGSALLFNIACSSDAATMYVGDFNSNHVYKSTDRGVTWNALSKTFAASLAKSVACSSDGAVVYVAEGTGANIWRSRDRGATFASVYNIPNPNGWATISCTVDGTKAFASDDTLNDIWTFE